MKGVLIEPGFQVNTQFRQNLTFLSVHLSLKSTDKAKSFPEDGFLLRYTDRGPGPCDEYLDFAPEEPSARRLLRSRRLMSYAGDGFVISGLGANVSLPALLPEQVTALSG